MFCYLMLPMVTHLGFYASGISNKFTVSDRFVKKYRDLGDVLHAAAQLWRGVTQSNT